MKTAMAAKIRTRSRHANVFVREGDFWTISYDGTLVRLKDSKGLRDIARLLARCDEKIHVTELIGPVSAQASTNGRDRVERARAAVTMRMRNALSRIMLGHPGLGRHFSNSIKTGSFCSYEPEAALHWQL